MKSGVDKVEIRKNEAVSSSGLAYWVGTLEEEGLQYDTHIRREIAIAILVDGFQRIGHFNGARTKDWLKKSLEEHIFKRSLCRMTFTKLPVLLNKTNAFFLSPVL